MAARKHLLVLLTLLATACTSERAATPSPPLRVSTPVEREPATKVRAVLDGRTVELADGTKARISLVAAPSSCAAAAALDFASKTLLDKEVRVSSITPGEIVLMLADGTDFALLAVRNGVLRTEGVDGGPLTEAETEASQAKRGLWAQDCPTATSTPAPPVTSTSKPASTPAPPPPPCAVGYRVTSQWPGAFQADVVVRNVSGVLIDGWTLRWRFGNGETVTQMWNATHSQNGADVTVTNAGYTALIVPDGSVSLGFNGSARGTTAAPSSFTLNGAACRTE
ncbi:cellulose binding domain-containing protein [Lentzea sp. NPDC051213]|uniref:cellulose binding domain-containing protein n=1 Tax=Lentzea sp. NPDC051213 TaxID=3364126 RepID=UPI0037A85257